MNEKCFIVMLGAGASGKTTARIGLCGELTREDRIRDESGRYFFTAIYDEYAVAGRHTTGADGNAAPSLIQQAADRGFLERSKVIFDGVMGSPRLVDIAEKHECRVLLVHFNLSEETILSRLKERRAGNGIVEDALPEKTRLNSLSFIRRAKNTLNTFETKCTRPMHKIEIHDSDSKEDVIQKIKIGVENCLSMPIAR